MGIFKSKKCRAKVKELCTDYDCPEKMYLKNAYDRAIKNNDFESFLKTKEEEKLLEPAYIRKAYTPKEWDTLVVRNTETQLLHTTAITPFIKEQYDRDVNVIEHYENYKDIEESFWENINITLRLSELRKDYREEKQLVHGFHLGDFYISPALRGQGVGEHIMKTLTTHADETGSVMDLVPTNAGDGKLSEGDKGWREAALAHRTRLVAFYERHGFELNPMFHSSNSEDYLTGEKTVYNWDDEAEYTKKGLAMMRERSQYIRWPNNKMPKGILKPVKKG